MSASSTRTARARAELLRRLRGSGPSNRPRSPGDYVRSWLGVGIVTVLVVLPAEMVDAGPIAAVLLVGIFGSSAIVLSATPQAPLAQPRNVIGGHVICAFVGVTTQRHLGGHLEIAAAVSVMVSLALMQLTRTLHPPGGGSALGAVVGGPAIHAVGYGYVVVPVLLGAVMCVAAAVLVQNVGPRRRGSYPVHWW